MSATTHRQFVRWQETAKSHRSWSELFGPPDREQVEIVCLLSQERATEHGGGVWHRIYAHGGDRYESMERNWYHPKAGDEIKVFELWTKLTSLPAVTFKDLRAAGLNWS